MQIQVTFSVYTCAALVFISAFMHLYAHQMALLGVFIYESINMQTQHSAVPICIHAVCGESLWFCVQNLVSYPDLLTHGLAIYS